MKNGPNTGSIPPAAYSEPQTIPDKGKASSEAYTQDTVQPDPFDGTNWSRHQDSLLVEQMKRTEGKDNANLPFSALVPRHTNIPPAELIDEHHSSPPEELYYKPEPLFGKLSKDDIICKKVPRQAELNKILREIKTRCFA